jgi:hypothetical protein
MVKIIFEISNLKIEQWLGESNDYIFFDGDNYVVFGGHNNNKCEPTTG